MFPDQLGVDDRREYHVGPVVSVISHSGDFGVVQTSSNSFGVLHLSSGDIVWRGTVTEREEIAATSVGENLVVVSYVPDSVFVRAFSVEHGGKLLWEQNIARSSKNNGPPSVQIKNSKLNNVTSVLMDGIIHSFSGSNGEHTVLSITGTPLDHVFVSQSLVVLSGESESNLILLKSSLYEDILGQISLDSHVSGSKVLSFGVKDTVYVLVSRESSIEIHSFDCNTKSSSKSSISLPASLHGPVRRIGLVESMSAKSVVADKVYFYVDDNSNSRSYFSLSLLGSVVASAIDSKYRTDLSWSSTDGNTLYVLSASDQLSPSGKYDVKVETFSTILPLETYVLSLDQSSGGVAAAFLLHSGSSKRVLVTSRDGHLSGYELDGSRLFWRSEGDVCTTSALSFSVLKVLPGVTDNENVDVLSLQARFRSQIPFLVGLMKGLVENLIGALRNVATKGVDAIVPARTIKSLGPVMAPPTPSNFDTILVFLAQPNLNTNSVSDVEGASHGLCHAAPFVPRLTGSLHAEAAETGEFLWSLSLPISHPPTFDLANPIHTRIFSSRARSIHGFSAEILVVEWSSPSSTDPASALPTIHLTWVNAETGEITSRFSYSYQWPLVRVARIPVVDSVSFRDIFLLEHANSAAVVVPSDAHTKKALTLLTGDSLNTVLSRDFSLVAVVDGAVVGRGLREFVGSDHLANVDHSFNTDGASISNRSLRRDKNALTVDFALFSLQEMFRTAVAGPEEHVLSFVGGSGRPAPSLQSVPSAPHQVAEPDSPSLEKNVHVLGDDSLLLRYASPHLLAVAVADAAAQRLSVYLVDGVSGRVVHMRSHERTHGPCHLLLEDNWLVYTHWNAAAARQELSSLALYEGIVDSHELTPWGRHRAADRVPWTSSFAPVSPFIAHRTYILPTSVHSMALTQTQAGLTSPHLLLAGPRGVLMVDKRLVEARRPSEPPKDFQKLEGLLQYSPYLPLRHTWLIEHGQRVPAVSVILSAPTSYESTTIVAVVGLDTHVARLAPAKAFDQLDSGFNFMLFASILIAGSIGTFILGRKVNDMNIKLAWK